MSQALSQPPVPPPRRYTLAEYIALEDQSEVMHEFHDGRVVEMTGGTPTNARLQGQVGAMLVRLLRNGPRQAYGPDLRIAVPRRRRYLYGDSSVVCGPEHLDPEDATGTGVLNVRAVVEIFSPTTANYDRSEKFDHYMTMHAFDTYILVFQDEPRVEVRIRNDDAWSMTFFEGLDAVAKVRTLGVELPLAEVYRGVSFPAAKD
jgi:Uma2 family endonuclease